MTEFPGFTVSDLIIEEGLFEVRRAIRLSDSQPVLLKYFHSDHPNAKEVSKLKKEYELASSLHSVGVCQCYELLEYNNQFTLVVEDPGSDTLASILPENGFDLAVFLNMAVQLSQTLKTMHQQDIIYRAFSPHNIFVTEVQDNVWDLKLSNFSYAVFSSDRMVATPVIKKAEQERAYYSPEQTGRINKIPDYRSDFYSLGTVLYQLLTGQLPFPDKDLKELVHCIIAKVPSSPIELSAKVPQVLSDIILKLLNKSPEERYRSAHGLMVDLQSCELSLKKEGSIKPFSLGKEDIYETFYLPEKLYGRSSEMEGFSNILSRCNRGSVEVLMLTGRAGVGKSALVEKVLKKQANTATIFLKGKFDQLTKGIAYSAISQAFKGLVRELLTESEEQLTQWRDELNAALDGDGQLIVDIIPDLVQVIGDQPKLLEMDAPEAKSRLQKVFQRFVWVFADIEHPLVVFLDDLQWADTGSLVLLESLVTDTETRYFFFIGAYRDDEVNTHHQAYHLVTKLKQSNVPLSEIHLEPLKEKDIDHLLADALSCSAESSAQLSWLTHRKTLGNAFFIHQFLRSLHDRNLITFSNDKHAWQWDIEDISNSNVTSNVVELMADKISTFPDETKRMMQLASILGATFSISHLVVISLLSEDQVKACLAPAILEGLILRADMDLRFLHDRVQEASYSTIAPLERDKTHIKVARLLLADTSEKELGDRIFDISGHFIQGMSLLTEKSECIQVAELFLAASQKAIMSSAFDSALVYSSTAIENLLPVGSWKAHYELTWGLYHDRGYCEYTTLKLEAGKNTLEICLKNSGNEEHRVAVHALISRVFFQMNLHHEAIQNTRDALAYLGIRVPKKITKKHVLWQLLKFRASIVRKRPEEIMTLQENTDPHILNVCRVLVDSGESAYMVDTDSMAYFSLLNANICLKYGNSIHAPFAYAMATLVLSGSTREFTLADKLAGMAIKLNEKYPDKAVRGRVHMLAANFSYHWKKPLEGLHNFVQIAAQCCTETGSLHWANYAIFFSRPQRILFNTDDLNGVIENNENAYRFFYDHNDREVLLQQRHNLEFCYWLSETERPSDKDEAFDPEAYQKEMEKSGNLLIRTYYYFFETLKAFMVEDYLVALKHAEASLKIASETMGNLVELPVRFYYLLIILQLKERSADKSSFRFSSSYQKPRRLLKHFVYANPDEYIALELIIRAEEAQATSQADAYKIYGDAVKAAQKTGHYFAIALANEMAAKYFLNQGQKVLASAHMKHAYNSYEAWGASAKTTHLRKNYAELLSFSFDHVTDNDDSDEGWSIDATAIVQASQVISQEIELPSLLSKLMEITIENSGAQVGYFILEKSGQLYIEAASGDVETSSVETHRTCSIENSPHLPEGIIRYVYRSGEVLVLDNAAHENGFSSDPYIEENNIKSVLCLPVLQKNRIIGVVYLENNLATSVFTDERLSVIKTIMRQASISLENSKLFEERRKIEGELRKREERFRSVIATANDGFWVTDSEGKILDVNDAYVRRSGYSQATLLSMTIHDIEANNTESQIVARMGEIVDTGSNLFTAWHRAQNGECWQVEASVSFVRNDGGQFYLFFRDITDRTVLEEQVRRSQKMEAVGQLTGGIAHDFNNILGIIQGNLELLQPTIAGDEKAEKRVIQALKGAHRGANITRKLLNFSRKDVQNITLVSVNDFIGSVKELVEKSLTASIKVEINLADNLWPTEINSGDLEDAILNLSINARDAMPDGGVLVIQTANKVIDASYARINPEAAPGDFVMISVSDTGFGMSKEIMDKVLEPFYTTKEHGKGTGLGLSMVFGFVQRSGGHLKIYSEIDEGTDIRLYLPRSESKIKEECTNSDDVKSLPRGSETILIVDDEEAMLDVAVSYLEDLGYATISATNGRSAQQLIESGRKIDLLFSDIIMTGDIDGYQLALFARHTRPAIAIILASGFTKKREEYFGSDAEQISLLDRERISKPYTQRELATLVRKILDRNSIRLSNP